MPDNLYAEYRKLSPKVTGGLIRMRSAVFGDGAVPAKHKILCALAIVVVEKCEHCLRTYTKMDYNAGVSKKNLLNSWTSR